jgi:ubiquinone/menaquinone biosynthesis C-methylase UbiE
MSKPSNVREQIDHYVRTARGFDRSVWSLGNRDNRNHRVKVEAIAEAIGAAAGGRILEVGAGTGLHARWLLEHTPVEYTGIDVSRDMLDFARLRLADHAERVRLTIGDAQRLPFPDRSFDSAFCTATLHHLGDPASGIRELARVVRLGGRVAAIEPNWKYPSVLVYTAITAAERNTFRISPARLEAWALASGLEDVRVRRLLYTPPSPKNWERIWDAVDRGVARVPGLRRLSIVLLLSGRVPD